jgi:TonB family protein
MTEAWKQWVGQAVNGEFRLLRYLGGCERGAVFQTERREPDPQRAAIKLIPADLQNAEVQLRRWAEAAKLTHPHLIQIFKTGRCQLDSGEFLYVVMEYAEEDLAQVLTQRPITASEAAEMLEPTLDALAYLHGKGLVHGHVKPANIMAVDDRLKLSSDSLCRTGEPSGSLARAGVYDAPEIAAGGISPAADVWSIGVTLFEALTQRLPAWEGGEQQEPVLPEILAEPFREIASHCLYRDPQRRWTVAGIAARLRGTSPAPPVQTAPAPQRGPSRRWRYLVPAVGLGLLLAVLFASPRLFNHQPEPQQAPAPALEQPLPERKPVAPEPAPSTTGNDDRKESSPSAAPSPAVKPSHQGVVRGEADHQVLPAVPRSARSTIRGKVKVSVRVRVSPTGSVVGAKLASPGPSKYFAEQALQAARHWKFSPPKVDGQDAASEWILRFEFGSSGTKAVPAQVAP